MSGSLYAALGQRDQVKREDVGHHLGTATPASASVNTSGNGLQYALLGLAGVLVGALITGGFNFLVAWRKERADAAAESKRHDVEVRRAARLIDDDLHAAAGAAPLVRRT